MLASPSVARLFGFIGTFLGVVVLHTLWDTFSGSLVFVVLAIISIGWLFWELRRYRSFSDQHISTSASCNRTDQRRTPCLSRPAAKSWGRHDCW
ncbi:hypothetical protein [Micromonospora sp. NPDC047187]|uniref:hypothetical protein n=1 Tax=Micromonospora sp. NPDC047187 TaxID=3155262 RepID=UPI0033E45C2D